MRGLRSLLYFWHIARHCGIDLAMTTILACRATLIMSHMRRQYNVPKRRNYDNRSGPLI